MSRERVTQLIGWLGLAWLLFVAGFFAFAADNSTVLSNVLHWVGLR